MADWTSIPNASLEAGKPVRAIDAIALRDNPMALAEGRPNAPRLSPWANAAVVAAGAQARYIEPNTYATTSTNFARVRELGLMNTGSVRVRFSHTRTSGTGQSRIKIGRVRAGVPVEILAETSFTPISQDVSIEPGDTIVIWHRCQDSGATCTLSGVGLYTDGELLNPAPPYFTFGAAPT